MSNISFPAADFTPQLTGYTGQGAFRFWCQKVLPIVYDDSLSYYELLNKVVVYLNNVIEDIKSCATNTEKLLDAYDKLQNYVNNFFADLNLDDALSEKLDSMVESGELEQLIFGAISAGYLNYVTPEMFGAKGDGVSDDSNAVTDASNTGLPVVFGNKSYVVHDVEVNEIEWIGNNTIIKLKLLDNTSNQFLDCITVNGGDCKITGITFDGGNVAVDYTSTDLELQGVIKAYDCNVRIHNCCFTGIHTKQEITSDIKFVERRGILITAIGCNTVDISNNEIDGCGGDEWMWIIRRNPVVYNVVRYCNNSHKNIEGYSVNIDAHDIYFDGNTFVGYTHEVTSITNFNGTNLWCRNNSITNSIFAYFIDTYEHGYFRVANALIEGNYCDCQWGGGFCVYSGTSAIIKKNTHIGKFFIIYSYAESSHTELWPLVNDGIDLKGIVVSDNNFIFSVDSNREFDSISDRYFINGLSTPTVPSKYADEIVIENNVIDFSKYDGVGSRNFRQLYLSNANRFIVRSNIFKGRIVDSTISSSVNSVCVIQEHTLSDIIVEDNTMYSPTVTRSNCFLVHNVRDSRIGVLNVVGNTTRNGNAVELWGLLSADAVVWDVDDYKIDFPWVCGGKAFLISDSDSLYTPRARSSFPSIKSFIENMAVKYTTTHYNITMSADESTRWLPERTGSISVSIGSAALSVLFISTLTGKVYSCSKSGNVWSEWVQH